MGTFPSILCISNHPANTLKQQWGIDLEAPRVDVFIASSDTSIGIELVRDINSFAQHPPLQHDQKSIVMLNAHTLTLEAQNALLKLLEEPPKHTRLILCAPHTQGFLDTVLSRCQIIRDTATDEVPSDTTTYLQPLLTASPAARLSLLPTDIKTVMGASDYCRQLIQETQTELRTNPQPSHIHNLSILTNCLTHLSANANPTLCLTDAILQLK